MFNSAFVKKIRVFFIEKGSKPQFFKTKIFYDKEEKKWYIRYKRDKIPLPEDIYEYLKDDTLMVVRKGQNIYEFIKLRNFEDDNPIEFAVIPPEELHSALIKAELRKERNKSMKDRLIMYIAIGIVVISLGIFLYIAWNSVGENMKVVAASFDSAMKSLENITAMQNEIIEKTVMKGGDKILPK